MSVVFVVIPAVMGGWPLISAAAAAAAASLGGKLIPKEVAGEIFRPQEVDLPVDGEVEGSIGEGEREEIFLQQEDVFYRLYRTEEGELRLHVDSLKRSKSELQRLGEQMLGRIRQQLAYHKLVTELKKEGFDVVEEALEGGEIRLKVRRFA
jgi:hypothetical protein